MRTGKKKGRRWVWGFFKLGAVLLVGLYLFWALALESLRYIDPPTTGVQIQRRVEAWIGGKPYRKKVKFIPLRQISPELQHAVISAEDGNFYRHHGIDWGRWSKSRMRVARPENSARGIDHHAATGEEPVFHHPSQSGSEGLRVYAGSDRGLILGKQRVMELYLNVDRVGTGSVWR